MVSYRMKLPPQARIHNVFHVIFLKKFEGVPLSLVSLLPAIVRGHAVTELEQVVRARSTALSWDILVQWQGRSAAEAMWEPLEMFKQAFPEFKL
jgi:hypothetical protein